MTWPVCSLSSGLGGKCGPGRSLVGFLLGGFLVDDADHLALDGLFLEDEAVLVPYEVGRLLVKVILLHAALEQLDDVIVVGVLGEAQSSAVVHELAEFVWLVLAQLVNRGLLFLLLDGSVLLGLGSSWQALPW